MRLETRRCARWHDSAPCGRLHLRGACAGEGRRYRTICDTTRLPRRRGISASRAREARAVSLVHAWTTIHSCLTMPPRRRTIPSQWQRWCRVTMLDRRHSVGRIDRMAAFRDPRAGSARQHDARVGVCRDRHLETAAGISPGSPATNLATDASVPSLGVIARSIHRRSQDHLTIPGPVGIDSRHSSPQPLANRPEGVVVERAHADTLEALVLGPTVPALPDRSRPVDDRVAPAGKRLLQQEAAGDVGSSGAGEHMADATHADKRAGRVPGRPTPAPCRCPNPGHVPRGRSISPAARSARSRSRWSSRSGSGRFPRTPTHSTRTRHP